MKRATRSVDDEPARRLEKTKSQCYGCHSARDMRATDIFILRRFPPISSEIIALQTAIALFNLLENHNTCR